MTIGIIDSGLGGYSIYHALHTAYPKASFHFLADQKNAPYGNKTQEEIKIIATKNIAWFESNGIKEVVIACNTLNAVALEHLKMTFPAIQFYDIVYPTVKQMDSMNIKSVLVVATRLAIQSNIYANTIHQLYPNLNVKSVALPELVTLIEGLSPQEEMTTYLHTCLNQTDLDQDVMILGCTHYPLALNAFNEIYAHQMLDSIDVMVKQFRHKNLHEGDSVCFTTNNADYAIHQVDQLFNINEKFTQIEI